MEGKRVLSRDEAFGKMFFDPNRGILYEFILDEEAYARTTHLSFPVTIHALLTYGCNANCPSCEQARHRDQRRAEMEFEDWKRVLEEAAEHGCFMLAIGGGEPLIYPRLFDIIDFANDLGLSPSVTTNGMLVRENMDRLKGAGIKQLQFSLDGHTPEIHNLTHKTPFREVVEAIRMCLAEFKKTRVGVNCIIHSGNVPHLDSYLEFCGNLGVYDVRLLSPKPPLPPLTPGEVAATREAIERHCDDLRIGVDSCLAIQLGVGRCFSGRRLLVINPYGDVLGCSHIQDAVQGNVLRESIKKIWDEKFEDFRSRTEGGRKCLLLTR